MRVILLVLCLGMPLFGIASIFYFGHQLRVFLFQVPRINSERDMEIFKRIVATQMYSIFVLAILLISPWLIFIYGAMVAKVLALIDFLYMMVPFAGAFLATRWMRPFIQEAKQIPAISKELEDARDKVVDIWVHKALPPW